MLGHDVALSWASFAALGDTRKLSDTPWAVGLGNFWKFIQFPNRVRWICMVCRPMLDVFAIVAQAFYGPGAWSRSDGGRGRGGVTFLA